MTAEKGTYDSGWVKIENDVPKPLPTAPPVETTTAAPGAKPGATTPVEVGNSRAHGGDK